MVQSAQGIVLIVSEKGDGRSEDQDRIQGALSEMQERDKIRCAQAQAVLKYSEQSELSSTHEKVAEIQSSQDLQHAPANSDKLQGDHKREQQTPKQ